MIVLKCQRFGKKMVLIYMKNIPLSGVTGIFRRHFWPRKDQKGFKVSLVVKPQKTTQDKA